MSQEVEDGIDDSIVKPGHIKVAIDAESSEPELLALRAGARTAIRYGLSMTVHQGMEAGPEVCDKITSIIEEEGLDPARVVIAHSDSIMAETNLQKLIKDPTCWGLRLNTARNLMRNGYNISMDCFGQNWDGELVGTLNVSDWQRMAGLYALINEGFSDQIVLGTDSFVKLNFRRYGGDGYCRLADYVVPTLQSVGISPEIINKLTVENPARILSY